MNLDSLVKEGHMTSLTLPAEFVGAFLTRHLEESPERKAGGRGDVGLEGDSQGHFVLLLEVFLARQLHYCSLEVETDP